MSIMDYPSWYMVAKNELAAGRKDAGLRSLFALRHDLTEVPSTDGDMQAFKKLLDDTIALWGEGFDWD